MQRHDDRPPAPRRPSLLSAETQADGDPPRILGGYQDERAAPGAQWPAKARSKTVWGMAGAGVVALAAGAWLWIDSEYGHDETTALSTSARGIATPATVAGSASGEEASTAVILEDSLAAKTPAGEQLPSLTEMLNAPAMPAVKTGGDELTKALERPASQVVIKPAVAKPAPAHVSPHAKVVQKKVAVAHKDKPPAKLRPSTPDSDVTLLAALMAHVQANKTVKNRPATQLKQCKQLSSAGAELCRARLCAADARNEAECKPATIAKASSGS